MISTQLFLKFIAMRTDGILMLMFKICQLFLVAFLSWLEFIIVKSRSVIKNNVMKCDLQQGERVRLLLGNLVQFSIKIAFLSYYFARFSQCFKSQYTWDMLILCKIIWDSRTFMRCKFYLRYGLKLKNRIQQVFSIASLWIFKFGTCFAIHSVGVGAA